jgi:hypothetical protein
MFKTKHVTSNATTTPKPPKLGNVLVNMVDVATTHSQQSEQQVLKERELVKDKGVEDQHRNKIYVIHLLKL